MSAAFPVAEPQTAALLERMGADFADAPSDPTIAERRQALQHMSDLYGPPEAPVGSVEDRAIPGPDGSVPVRIYRPAAARPDAPLILHLHGGGWTVGDPDAYARVCRAYCAAADAVVVDVHYRRAPESRFPAALEDAEAALNWAVDNARALGAAPGRIVVAGDSAGGNLAAALCQRTHHPLALQVLVYPVLSTQAQARFASRSALGDGRFFLREFDIRRAEQEYLADPAEGDTPDASPLLGEASRLSRLPPTLIVAAELDPLRDEAEVYAERLRQAGVSVAFDCVPGTIHGFVLFAGAIDLGMAAIARIGEAVRRAQG